jgi:hypothetical protein
MAEIPHQQKYSLSAAKKMVLVLQSLLCLFDILYNIDQPPINISH